MRFPFALLLIPVATLLSTGTLSAQFDFGDAPDPTYPTLLASGGARHSDPSQEWLGPAAAPAAGCPNTATVEGDANVVDLDADDGLASWWFDPPTGNVWIEVRVSLASTAPAGTRYLNVLIDLDTNGDWAGPDEWAVVNFPLALAPGTCSFPVNLGLGAPVLFPFSSWVRVTLTRDPIPGAPGAGPWVGTGLFSFGETEDYNLTWSPGLPVGGGGPAPGGPFLAFRVSCRPKNRTIAHGGGAQAFTLAFSGGTIRPNNAKAVQAFAGPCTSADGFAWVPAPGTVFGPVAPGTSILPIPASVTVIGAIPRCLPSPDETRLKFFTWYFNPGPALPGAPIGAAGSGDSCRVSVTHP